MNNFMSSYEIILKVLNEICDKQNFIRQIRKPKLSDLELIALNLTAEYSSIDSESQLFRKLPEAITNKIERSVYNRRKRKLAFAMEKIRQKLSRFFNEYEDYYIVDSMPLEVVKLARSSRSKICKEKYETAPDMGYSASQKMYFYGYKLHAVASVNGIIQSFDLTKASTHDIRYLTDIKYQFSDCVIIGDKGYLNAEYQLDLFTSNNIKLEVPMRANQHNYKKQASIFRRTRKRIETIFSQLCDQFMIRRNYAKTFDGFRTRIISKITSFTIIQYINKFIYNRNINNVKINIA